MHADIQNAKNAWYASRKHFNQAVARVQKECEHKDLVEGDYVEDRWGCSHIPPVRVCRTCGMAEDGWGSGHQVLKGEAYPKNRDEALRLHEGLWVTNEVKGPLSRKETTVKVLIDDWYKQQHPNEVPQETPV